MKPTLALIDIGLFWGFWHGAKDQPPGTGLDRYVGMCRTVSLRHTRTIVCADSDMLFRRSIPGGEGYKSGSKRDEKPEEAKAELARAPALIKALGLPIWQAEGFEADDGLAAWAREAVKAGWQVRVYSEDKDLEVLTAEDGITIYKRDREKGGSKDWTAEDVRNRRGVPAARMTEMLALAGDAADSIPGVKGIGEEAAKAVIAAYPHVLDAYSDLAPDGTPGAPLEERIRKALARGRADLELSLALVTLDRMAEKHLDASLLVPPELVGISDPPASPPKASSEVPEVAHVTASPDGNGTSTATEVLHKVQEAPPPPSMLDQVAETTTQRARAEGWIGSSFADRLEPKNLDEAWRLAGILDQAMSPGKGRNDPPTRTYAKIGNRSAIFAVILKGTEINLPAMLSLAHIKPVEGKLEVDAMLMMAIALRSGRIRWFKWLERTEEKATLQIQHADADRAPESLTWDLDTANRAGLYPASSDFAPWKKYTRVMLRWRAISELLRAVVPEAVTGLYVPGEIGELDEEDVRRGVELETRLS